MAEVKVSRQETITAIQGRKVPKGDIYEFARAASLLAIKRTSDVIPDCHPLPIEFAEVTYSIDALSVIINVEVHTIYKTGVEVEAMHGASVAALVMYDMLKPIDKGVEIHRVRLLHKSGGKSDTQEIAKDLTCAVIVCSDTVSKGQKEDTAGKKAVAMLEKFVASIDYHIVADEIKDIRQTLGDCIDKGVDLVIFTGGTGLSKRDITPEAVVTMIDTFVPGIMETMRGYGQQRTPHAMLSRGIAGFAGNTLVLTLPGSQKGVEESLSAVLPSLFHVFSVRNGASH